MVARCNINRITVTFSGGSHECPRGFLSGIIRILESRQIDSEDYVDKIILQLKGEAREWKDLQAEAYLSYDYVVHGCFKRFNGFEVRQTLS